MKDVKVINVREKLSLFDETWAPKIIGEVNDTLIKVVKFQGEYSWHSHEKEDELFWAIDGRFRIELRDKTLELREGDLVIIPHGVEHKPVADELAQAVVIESKTTVNTGDSDDSRRIEPDNLERI
jgi:mannose-6-phosphate isomerase-like protein (cupin superfamily)